MFRSIKLTPKWIKSFGWGFAGLCPGPAMFLAFAGYPNVLFRWWPSFFVGSILAEKVKDVLQSNEANSKQGKSS